MELRLIPFIPGFPFHPSTIPLDRQMDHLSVRAPCRPTTLELTVPGFRMVHLSFELDSLHGDVNQLLPSPLSGFLQEYDTLLLNG